LARNINYPKIPETTDPETKKFYESIFNVIRDMKVDLVYPIGSFYTQYPSAESSDLAIAFPDSASPAIIFGGAWEIQFNDEGICFYTEPKTGDLEQTRTNGLQEDQGQGHVHNFESGGDYDYAGTGYAGHGLTLAGTVVNDVDTLVKQSVTDGTNGTPRKGSTTKGRNRLIRVWKRTA
jgi:hypothetical protein